MIQSDVVVTSDGRTVTVGEWLAENVARRRAAEVRVAELEQELAKTNAMLREYMLIGPVDDLVALKAENARLLTPPRLRVRQSKRTTDDG